MKIKNDYIKIKQGKKEIELHNLILDKYLDLFADSLLNLQDKGLEACLINCTVEEEISQDMTEMHWDFFLNEQNLYNNNDYKGESKIITQYLYESNYEEQMQNYIGQKILSIGFAKFIEEADPPGDSTFELYAILDVSNYNLYVQKAQDFIVERVDTTTTDLKFYSQTEKYPIHLSPRGNAYFDEEEETGTHELAKLTKVGKGFTNNNPYLLIPIEQLIVSPLDNEISIKGISISAGTEFLYPSEDIFPSNELYPKEGQMKWIIYEFSIYKFIDTVTGYVDTGRKYYMSKHIDNTGNLDLKIRYERG